MFAERATPAISRWKTCRTSSLSPNTHPSECQQPINSVQTPLFVSWTTICLETEKNRPEVDCKHRISALLTNCDPHYDVVEADEARFRDFFRLLRVFSFVKYMILNVSHLQLQPQSSHCEQSARQRKSLLESRRSFNTPWIMTHIQHLNVREKVWTH